MRGKHEKTNTQHPADLLHGADMHILDGMVTEVLHQIFDKMKAVDESEIVARTQMNVTADLKDQLAAARREFSKATKEYEAVKAKLMVYGDNVFEKCGINRDGAGEVGKPRYFNGKRHF